MPVLRSLLILGVIGLFNSCEVEDDIPPPSAYEEPEPVDPEEGCIYEVIVPDLAEGIDFECGGPETTFFEEAEGSITIEPVENPNKEGINTSEKVMQITQTEGVQPWAGFFFDVASKIDFSEKQTIKIKVYSPAAGHNINLKLEDSSDGTVSAETGAISTVANEWEELSFAFSPSDSNKFDRMVLFFNFNGDKDATTVHYYDDIVLAEGSAIEELPGSDAEPSDTADNPTLDQDKVISLFSDVYTNVVVDTWLTEWSDATLEDVSINDNNIKKYSEVNVVGIETVSAPIDASAMTHFHINIWTANATEMKIKLVDFGADGAFDGGDDVEHEITIENVAQQQWVSLDIPLSDFTNLTTRANLAQLIFVTSPSRETTFIDNVYFYDNTGVITEPETAAPIPSLDESAVISMFSDAYTDVPVDTWKTDWSSAALEDITIAGNAVKKYSDLDFVGIETANNQIDASEMAYFHTDVWTGNATVLKIKLVDFGADGAYDGGDDVEHEIVITDLERNTWTSLKIALSDFTGLSTRANISQLIYAAEPTGSATIFIDNVYFSK